jgi:ABC-type transport system substrate-binding protein
MKKRGNRTLSVSSCTLLIFIITVVLVLSSCGSGTPEKADTDGDIPAGSENGAEEQQAAGEPQYGGTFRLAWHVQADSQQQIGVPWRIQRGVYHGTVPCLETLVLAKQDGDFEPWLAESYNIDYEKSQVNFTIRKGVKFHDGSDLTPDVVAWNFNKWIEEKAFNPYIEKAEVSGDDVVITLKPYQNSFLFDLSSHQFAIISKEAYEKYGEPDIEQHPVGTGPFILDSMVPGQRITFKKNPDYWQEGKPYLDAIEFVDMQDNNTKRLAMLSATGDQAISVAAPSTAQQASEYEGVEGVRITSKQDGVQVLFPSSVDSKSPLANKQVREAVSLAIDREALCKARGFGFYKPINQIFLPDKKSSIPDTDPSVLKSFDPEQAKKILSEAGYPDGFKTSIVTATNTPGVDKDIIEAMAVMLRNIGIEVETIYLQTPEKNSQEMNGWEGFMVSGITEFTNDAFTWQLHGMEPDYMSYPSLWRPADEMRDSYDKARSTVELDQTLAQDIHRMYLDNVAIIPLYSTEGVVVEKDYVHDFDWTEYGSTTGFKAELIWLETDKIK